MCGGGVGEEHGLVGCRACAEVVEVVDAGEPEGLRLGGGAAVDEARGVEAGVEGEAVGGAEGCHVPLPGGAEGGVVVRRGFEGVFEGAAAVELGDGDEGGVFVGFSPEGFFDGGEVEGVVVLEEGATHEDGVAVVVAGVFVFLVGVEGVFLRLDGLPGGAVLRGLDCPEVVGVFVVGCVFVGASDGGFAEGEAGFEPGGVEVEVVGGEGFGVGLPEFFGDPVAVVALAVAGSEFGAFGVVVELEVGVGGDAAAGEGRGGY